MYIYVYIYICRHIYIYICRHIYIYIWLVVSTPLKNTKVSWDDYSQYMEKVFQTMKPNIYIYIILHILMLTTRHPLNTELNGDSPPPSLARSLSLSKTHCAHSDKTLDGFIFHS